VSTRAELVADGGAAAASEDDFFRSPPFLAAEAVTHSLLVGDTLALPLIVRDIPGQDLRDAISPYGYPGGSPAPAAGPVDPGEVDWSATGLVSAFIRDRIGGSPCFTGATERSTVQVHDPAQPRRMRSRLVEQIRANVRGGIAVDSIPGSQAEATQRAGFIRAYDETMRRARAADRYLYPATYFEAILAFEHSWLVVAREPEGGIAAGAIAALSDGVLHYYLGGTADAHLDESPFKNVVGQMMDLADELEAPLNLGGGMKPGDGLEAFKRGFANAELPFNTHELVLDGEAYARLSGEAADSDFFPAYRAPA
jgi:hypothetical protein